MKEVIKYLLIVFVLISLIILVFLLFNKKEKQDIIIKEESTPPPERYTKVKEKYECNEFEFVNVTTDSLMAIYLNKFKTDINADITKSYQDLNKEYRESRFSSIDDYKDYINKNYNDIMKAKLSKYKADNTNSDFTVYTCIDTNNNYYLFKESAVMQYDIFLDNYTIPTKDFIEEYNSVSEQKKVVLNIQKFVKALNDNSMYYAYNLLSNGFKNNYFKTQEDFEQYVNDNLFNGNIDVKYGECEEENGVFKYNITIINKGNAEEKIEKTIFMKLNKGTDFEMSFNV